MLYNVSTQGWLGANEVAYSSRIQLPTEVPPQLIPVTMLPARLSRLGFSRLDALTDIGCAAVPNLGLEPPKPDPNPLKVPPLISIAGVGLASLPEVVLNAAVRFEDCGGL